MSARQASGTSAPRRPFGRRRRALACLGALLLAVSGAQANERLSLERQDGRPTKALAYTPANTACRGVALVSPGAGGSEQEYRYLGTALSSQGYLTLVVGHAESGRDALRERVQRLGLRDGLEALVTDPVAYRGRQLDLDAARAWARPRCPGEEAVLIGHSMGAATVMMAAGARNRLGVETRQRFDAYIALSPQGTGPLFPPDAWGDVRQPTLLITGTRDTGLGGASWETRTEPFRAMPAGCKWLGVIDGATHMHFAGHGASARVESLTVQTIGAFLDGVRRGDCRLAAPLEGIAINTR